LLLAIILGPEADTSQGKRPVDRGASIGMRSSQTSVVLQHEELKLGKFSEEVHTPRLLVGRVIQAILKTLGIWKESEINGQNIINQFKFSLPPASTISLMYQTADLSTEFLFPFISCCLKAQSGSGVEWVHMETLVGTWISLK
jgi:hypothetical protein